jgi:hypothetical protein
MATSQGAFQFRRRRPPTKLALPRGASSIPVKAPREQEVVGLIQGRVPMSRQEWRVAVALWKYKIEFLYQIPIWGIVGIRGAQVLDFLVYNPFPQPIQIFGEYWHSAQIGSDDWYDLAVIQSIYGVEPITLWSYELETQEQTNQTIRRVLRL